MLHLISHTNPPPIWIQQGIIEYQTRLHKPYSLTVTDIPLKKQNYHESIISLLAPGDYTIALAVTGQPLSTEQFASKLESWAQSYKRINFIIGGPDGLPKGSERLADFCFSLSALTLPHALAKLMLVEQLYRAYTLIIGHPYHRK